MTTDHFGLTNIRLPGGLSAVEAGPSLTGPPSTGTSPDRPPVLLLHGMMGGAWQFSHFQRALADSGYRSLAVNYRGHHDSLPVARLGRVRVRDYLADALHACAHLGGQPLVVGQSMGGLIAQLVAARGAARAAVLVCSLPPKGIRWRGVHGPLSTVRHLPAVLLGRPLRPRRAELDDLILNGLPADRRAEFFDRQVPESSRVGAEMQVGTVEVDPAAVTCPVLSVTTGLDRLVVPGVGIRLARRYRGDHLHFADRAHYALVGEPGWELVAASIISWLDEHR